MRWLNNIKVELVIISIHKIQSTINWTGKNEIKELATDANDPNYPI